MKRLLSTVINIALMLILPIWGWLFYLDSSRHTDWAKPIYSRTVCALLILIALIGVQRLTVRWSLNSRVGLGALYSLFLFFVLFYLGFASALVGANQMP